MTPAEFKRIRLSLGLTQPELGALLGYTPEHISRLERGISPVHHSISVLMKICEWSAESFNTARILSRHT